MRNSEDSPLIIAEVPTPKGGILGLTTCPGKKDPSRDWDRDLATDIQAIAHWGASAVVTLIEDHEFTLLGIEELGDEVVLAGLHWWHLPIRDVDVPDARFEAQWQEVTRELHERLAQGERILIHCRGGLGRTGLLAARISVEQGVEPRRAIAQVRAARPGAIETREQEAYVLNVRPLEAPRARRLQPAKETQRLFRGCLLGGAVGDALGAPVEFLSQSEIIERFGAPGIRDMVPAYGKRGAITDDTQMTLFTADGVLRSHVRGALRGSCHPPSVMHYAYLRWLHTQGRSAKLASPELHTGWLMTHRELFDTRAPGNTCLSALAVGDAIGEPASNNSKGCGGVMRVAPIGMLYAALGEREADRYERAFALGCDAAALTHGHPTGFLAAGVMAVLVLALLEGKGLESAIDLALPHLCDRERHEETLAALKQARALARDADIPVDAAIAELGAGWVAEEALAIGIYCALRTGGFEDGVVMAVNHGGDSDSTGLIAGHLLGIMHGVEAIPERWLTTLELQPVLAAVADDLATVAEWPLSQYPDESSSELQGLYVERYPA